MPQLIEHIDAIARKYQRDVLYLTFHQPAVKPEADQHVDLEGDIFRLDNYNYSKDPLRTSICQWLTEHNISWRECGHIASETMMMSYQGQIYIDVPYDENDPKYQLVRDYLENPDGSMRYPTVIFWCLPLSVAMQNAHHDEPGFWEKWAETF